MKKIKIAMTALVAVAGIVTMFAFTSTKTARKSFATNTYYFDTSYGLHYTIGSLVQSEVKTASNWNPLSSAIFSNNSKLAAITFDEDLFDANGGSDGQITLQEAIDEVWDYYHFNNNTLPADNLPIYKDFTAITIRRRL